MKAKIRNLEPACIDQVIRMAWDDRCSFERIEKELHFAESDVIAIMRRELKPRSFKLWRKRVTGRVTKHRKRFKQGGESKGSFE